MPNNKELPMGGGGSRAPLTPQTIALARTVDDTVSASTEITLNAGTTIIRVKAGTNDVYMKWGTADVTASNFDEIIPGNQICDYYVPTDSTTSARFTAANFIERSASSSIVVTEK